MRIIPFPLFSIAVIALVAGCASAIKQKFLDEPYQGAALSAPLDVSEIIVADGRKTAGTEQVSSPKFTFKKTGDTVAPLLTTRQEQVIREEISRYASGSGRRVTITATLKDGCKQWEQGFLHSREYARAAVSVELHDSVHMPCLFSATGESNYEVKAVFADTAFLEALYQKALKTSVSKAFESIGDFLERQADSAGGK